MNAVIPRQQALIEASRAVAVARARRDALPIREAARQAAVGSRYSADEIELILRRLHRTAQQPSGPAAAVADAA
ncbi:hypothetical protein ACFU7T_25595 [Streptomyces sp. NPDC057555]|uniref:hypothetical protein n=1 Tax=Streptomyces sp. NPDC057555 TaxID=3346166 RepID=UPI0036C936A9